MTAESAHNGAKAIAQYEPYRAGALVSLLRLHWFIRLRWTMMFGALAALAIERFAIPTVTRPTGLIVVILAIGAVNLGWMTLSRLLTQRLQASQTSEHEAVRSARVFANAQVATDLLLLTLILRYTGGVESSMAIFYLFHMAICSLLLTGLQAALQGIWAVCLYGVLGAGELFGLIGQHYEFLPTVLCAGHYQRPEFVACAVFVLACGVFGTLYFTLKIAGRLDNREHRLRATLAALQQSQTAIRDIQARRSRFMQTAAHQLKSPLAGIQTLAGLIHDGIVEGDAVIATCDKIGRRCRAGIDSVTELLTLARVQDADPQRYGETTADVGVLAADICGQRAREAVGAGIELKCHVAKEGDLLAHVERTDLVACLDNLIDNAIKYTSSPGTVTVTVRRAHLNNGIVDNGATVVKANVSGGLIAAIVEDTGMGIDADQLVGADGSAAAGSVFDAFRRGNGALAAGIAGSGLGLAIVRTVVEQAGGRLQVRSRPGIGSTFIVMFPAEQSLPAGPRVRDTRASEVIIDSPRSEDDAGITPTEEPNNAG